MIFRLLGEFMMQNRFSSKPVDYSPHKDHYLNIVFSKKNAHLLDKGMGLTFFFRVSIPAQRDIGVKKKTKADCLGVDSPPSFLHNSLTQRLDIQAVSVSLLCT